MIKFFGTPLQEIKSKTSNKMMFRFDTKGEFITDDEEIIRRAMGHFDYLPLKAEITGEKVMKTITQQPLTITVKGEEVPEIKEEVPEIKEEAKRQCKKCDYSCDSQGELLAHYRVAHKKEG